MRAHIFANSPHRETTDSRIFTGKKADLIIAADGGAEQCRRLNITPHLLIGDLDSISPRLVEKYTHTGVEVIRHPSRKDATDLELSLDLAMNRGAADVVLFGVLGGRWDMSLSNVMLAASEKYSRMRISLHDVTCRMHIIHGGSTLDLEGVAGQITSLIPLSDNVHGVTITGFEYLLKNSTLPFGSSRGISNVLLKTEGRVTLRNGVLLCIEELTQSGLPGTKKITLNRVPPE